MTELTYYFDPLCPWSWRTSVWIREVQRQSDLNITWKFLSLAETNNRTEAEMNGPLRVIALARRQTSEDKNTLTGQLYEKLGTAIHESGNPVWGVEGAIEKSTKAGLKEAGLDEGLWEQALADQSTLDEVLTSHRDGQERYKAFGVPWLVLGDQDFGFYGPVIKDAPTGQAALDLWQHASFMLTQPYLYELKRDR